jgi:hypothetical protein
MRVSRSFVLGSILLLLMPGSSAGQDTAVAVRAIAREKFSAAQKAPAGPERQNLFTEAASMYERALAADPSGRDAGEAALNGAFSFRELGRVGDAIRLESVLLDKYGAEETLEVLGHGDSHPGHLVAPDPQEYRSRVGLVRNAYDALVKDCYAILDYRLAADTLAKEAARKSLADEIRLYAASGAVRLYLLLGDYPKASVEYALFSNPGVRAVPEKRAEASYAMASFRYSQWRDMSEPRASAAARALAIHELQSFHDEFRGKPGAAPFVLESAYRVGTMMRAAGDTAWHTWFKKAIDAWQFFKANPQPGPGRAEDSPYRDYAGEAAYALVDDQLREMFDYASGHHRYKGTVVEVKKAIDRDLDEMKKWQFELEKVKDTYGGVWTLAAMARTGTLYESLRSGLDASTPIMVSPETQAKLAKLQKFAALLQSGKLSSADCMAQLHVSCDDGGDKIKDAINDVQDAMKSAWRSTKDQYLHEITQAMVDRYAFVAVMARSMPAPPEGADFSVRRLEYFTSVLGQDAMKAFVENAPDPLHTGQKLTYRNSEFQPAGALPEPPGAALLTTLPVTP